MFTAWVQLTHKFDRVVPPPKAKPRQRAWATEIHLKGEVAELFLRISKGIRLGVRDRSVDIQEGGKNFAYCVISVLFSAGIALVWPEYTPDLVRTFVSKENKRKS